MKKLLFILIILVPLMAFGEDILRVRSIKVEGLKRTKESVFMKIIGIKKGDEWNSYQKKHVERRLEKIGSFRNIEVKETVDGSDVDLKIYAQDKWTLLGFPLASSSKNSTAYGAAFIESNLFGMQKALAGVFLIKEKKPQISLFLIDQYFIKDKWVLFGSLQINDEDVAYFERKSIRFTIAPGYRINKYLTLSGIFSYHDYEHELFKDSQSDVLPVDSRQFITGLNLEYDNIDQKEDYFEGVKIQGEVTAIMSKDVPDFFKSYLRTEFYITTFKKHTLGIVNHLSLSFNTPLGYGFRVGSDGSYDALPMKGFEDNEFLYNNVLSGTVEYKVPVKSFSAFTLAVVPFFDYAFMADKRGKLFSEEFISSAGVALRLYIRKVAFPAFQMYIAHNNDLKKFRFGVQVGGRF